MDREKIEKLEDLLHQELGNDKKIVATKISRLTSPGENYGGLLLKVDLTLEDAKGKQEYLNVVAKTIPINPFMQKMFNVQVSVKKEIAVYETIVPEFQRLQREQGASDVIDFLAKMYGARLNLNGSDVVDEHSVILLENLVQSGYINVDRLVGFDLDTSKFILKQLAIYHSTALALRLCKPDVFEEKVKPYLADPKREKPPMPENGEEMNPGRAMRDFFQTCEEIRPLIPKLQDIIEFDPENEPPQIQGLYATISHGDLWVNNIMVKFENDKPIAMKFLDFQNINLRSLLYDLVFFLLSSIQLSILKTRFDELIKFYHDAFVKNLDQLKCDSTPYTFEKLLKDIKIGFKPALGQAIGMLMFVILNKNSKFAPVDDIPGPPKFALEDISPEARERVIFILNHFNEKGWL